MMKDVAYINKIDFFVCKVKKYTILVLRYNFSNANWSESLWREISQGKAAFITQIDSDGCMVKKNKWTMFHLDFLF